MLQAWLYSIFPIKVAAFLNRFIRIAFWGAVTAVIPYLTNVLEAYRLDPTKAIYATLGLAVLAAIEKAVRTKSN